MPSTTKQAEQKKKPAGWRAFRGRNPQAALSHMEVSNALLIIGMFIPKLALLALLAAGLAGFSAMGAVSAARSHDPNSWERATEKNRST
jgi:hypothetical protein